MHKCISSYDIASIVRKHHCEEESMIENRRHKRYQVTFFMKIIKEGTGDVFGHIVDISSSGFRALTDRYVTTDENYTLKIDLPKEMEMGELLVLKAKCVWTREDEDSGAFYSGLQMIDITREEQEAISQLLVKLDEM